MTAPLAGIRVLEIASFVAVPAAGALLADLGAEVVKVEVPRGEIYRYAVPRVAGYQSRFSEAPHFQMDNRGKRSLALDLKRPAAREALDRVIERSDIVLTNMLPERLERFGLDGAALRARWPQLIFASLSGYGQQGDEANTPAFDYTAFWSRSGFMDQLREPGAAPAFLRPGVGDHSAALSLVAGILAALRVRDQGGEGQEIEVSLLHIGFYIQGNDAAMSLVTRETPPRHDRRNPRNPIWNHYEVKDDRWLFLVMIESDNYWPEFCRAIGRSELIDDARFVDAVARFRNSSALVEILDSVFREHTLAEWEERLARHRLIWSPVRTLAEAIEDPQAHAGGVFSKVSHPTAGTFESVAPPLKLSAHPMHETRPAPGLGADGEQVLREAGLAPEEIEAALRT